MDKTKAIENLRAELPAWITRHEAPGYNARTLANMDCRGVGPPQRIIRGRTVYYPRDVYLEWLAGQITIINRDDTGHAD